MLAPTHRAFTAYDDYVLSILGKPDLDLAHDAWESKGNFGGPFRCCGSLDGGTVFEPEREIENKIMGNRLYVGNLSFSATNDTVRTAFAQFGEITDVHVVSD